MENSSLVPAPAAEPTWRPGGLIAAASLDDVYKFAERLAKSKLVPERYYQKPDDTFTAMVLGLEVGLQPMAALQSIAVINGQPGLYGDGFLAVIMASPHYLKHEEYYVLSTGETREHLTAADLTNDDTCAVSKFWRKGIPKPFTGTFSIANAKKAKLWTKEGPWQTYPQRQLMWRARGFGGRNGFAPELRGFRIVAELVDMQTPDIDVSVEESRVIEMPKRRSEKLAAPAPEPPVDATPKFDLTSELPAEGSSPSASSSSSSSSSTRPGRAAKSSPATTPRVMDHMVITHTEYVADPSGVPAPFTRIKAQVSEPGKPPIGYEFVTRDREMAALAESGEGSPQKFKLTWAPGHFEGTIPQTKELKILTAIAAS